jgi:hypothetical protein
MTLTELINEYARDAANSGQYATATEALNAASIDEIDDTWYSSRYLVTYLGPADYRIVSGSLAAIGEQDPLVKDIHQSLNGEGIDFSTDTTQGMIDQLGAAAGWSAEIIGKLKAIGRWTISPARKHLSRDVTQQEVQDAWVIYTLTNWLGDRTANAQSQINSGSITSTVALRTYLGAE